MFIFVQSSFPGGREMQKEKNLERERNKQK